MRLKHKKVHKLAHHHATHSKKVTEAWMKHRRPKTTKEPAAKLGGKFGGGLRSSGGGGGSGGAVRSRGHH